MSGREAIITVILYGSKATDPVSDARYGEHQRRLEVELRPRLPARRMSPAEIQQWVADLLKRVHADFKHSQSWHCEFCDKLAKETQVQLNSWAHLNPPRLTIYLHLMCNSVKGPCFRTMSVVNAQVNAMTRMPPQSGGLPRVVDEGALPIAATCAECHKEETLNRDMKKCSGCQITRYCSVKCQTGDWTRHREFCKMKKEVKWVWN